jgi:hypothetical protein
MSGEGQALVRCPTALNCFDAHEGKQRNHLLTQPCDGSWPPTACPGVCLSVSSTEGAWLPTPMQTRRKPAVRPLSISPCPIILRSSVESAGMSQGGPPEYLSLGHWSPFKGPVAFRHSGAHGETYRCFRRLWCSADAPAPAVRARSHAAAVASCERMGLLVPSLGHTDATRSRTLTKGFRALRRRTICCCFTMVQPGTTFARHLNG